MLPPLLSIPSFSMNNTNPLIIYGVIMFTLSAQISLALLQIKRRRKALTFFTGKRAVVSTPGKALIAGGYTVLGFITLVILYRAVESPNIAITVAVTARFYAEAAIQSFQDESNISNFDVELAVNSPQFHITYSYGYRMRSNEIVLLSVNGNNFVEKCLSIVFKFVKHFYGEESFIQILGSVSKLGKIVVTLQADNDFYSQVPRLKEMKLPLLSSSLQQLPRFQPCDLRKDGTVSVAKTGMGSSAALVSSLVGALLHFFNVVNLEHRDENDLRVVHNVSQLAHSVAQGKIGSGFDVSAAIYGSQIYQRFSAENLEPYLHENCSAQEIYDAVMTNSLWTQSFRFFNIPPRLSLVMGDVCGGAESTSMARNVLRWKSSSDESLADWSELAESNKLIDNCMQLINHYAAENIDMYDDFIDWAESRPFTEWMNYSQSSLPQKFLELKDKFSKSRLLLRAIGEKSNVEIEPKEQTILVDATESIPGVLCSSVPGAGGRDALYCIVLSDNARIRVESLWSSWSKSYGIDVCPLILTNCGKQEGIRHEL